MDWEDIQRKYPKAFGKFSDTEYCGCYYDPQLKKVKTANTLTYDRDLYDFFDGEEIFIHLGIPYSIEGGLDGFSFDIHGDKGGFSEQKYYSTRTEAEEQAFERAFEILNNKLESK